MSGVKKLVSFFYPFDEPAKRQADKVLREMGVNPGDLTDGRQKAFDLKGVNENDIQRMLPKCGMNFLPKEIRWSVETAVF